MPLNVYNRDLTCFLQNQSKNHQVEVVWVDFWCCLIGQVVKSTWPSSSSKWLSEWMNEMFQQELNDYPSEHSVQRILNLGERLDFLGVHKACSGSCAVAKAHSQGLGFLSLLLRTVALGTPHSCLHSALRPISSWARCLWPSQAQHIKEGPFLRTLCLAQHLA